MMKRALSYLCIAILLIPLGVFAQSKHRSKSKPKKSVHQLRKDLAQVRNRQEEIRKQIRTTRHVSHVVLADIHQVDAKLSDLEGKLEETGNRLDDSRTRQKQVAAALAEANKRLVDTKDAVRRRIRRMYMEGDSNLLTVLVGAGDVGEISSREYVLRRIAAQDKHVFDNYVQARNDVRSKKAEADDLVHRVAGLLAAQQDQQDSLKDTRKQKGEYLSQLRENQSDLQRMLRQFDEDEQSIASEIESYMRRQRGSSRPGEKLPPYTGGRFSPPVSGRLTSNFGMRYHPILHIYRMHSGVDFGAAIGTRIHAAAGGVVIHSSYMNGYGNVVIVDHGGGVSTVYAHCSRIVVSDGEHVKRGQYIANVGSTGLSTGPHLHFEVRLNGRPVNPLRYLR